MANVREIIEKYHQFWKGKNKTPLIGFQLGSLYLAETSKEAGSLLEGSRAIAPEMLDVAEFVREYECLSQKQSEVNHQTLWSVTPLPDFPWIDAFLGCGVYASSGTFWVKNAHLPLESIEKLAMRSQNPWFVVFADFTKRLSGHFGGKLPMGHPLFKGPLDLLAVLRGQERFIYDIYDFPIKVKSAAENLATIVIKVVRKWYELAPPFLGGYGLGVYDLWTPTKCVRLQEDALTLLSPDLYRRLFLAIDREITSAFPYSIFHLHPSCLAFLEDLLTLPDLKLISICKDPEPSVKELIPALKRVQERKLLMFRGEFTKEDVGLALSYLRPQGLYLQMVIPTVEEARRMWAYIQKRIGSSLD